jgi:hypothetical protein
MVQKKNSYLWKEKQYPLLIKLGSDGGKLWP